MYTIINVNGDSTNATLNKTELEAIAAGNPVIKIQDVVIKDGYPELSLLYISKNTDPRNNIDPPFVIRHVWLTPFRGYAFQVSGTINGEGDLGSTPVVGLGNIINAFATYTGNPGSRSSIYASNFKLSDLPRPIFAAMAKAAIMEFHMNANWQIRASTEPRSPYMKFSYGDEQNLNIFVRLCVECIANGSVTIPTVEEMGERFDIYSEGVWIKTIEGDELKPFLSNQKASYTSQTLALNDPE